MAVEQKNFDNELSEDQGELYDFLLFFSIMDSSCQVYELISGKLHGNGVGLSLTS